jgi:predicted transcriptional regulator YheO
MDEPCMDSLTEIAKGIADTFGPDCEVCIHDLKSADPEHTIVYIINGQVTGRKIGDSASGAVLKAMEAAEKGDVIKNQCGYRTYTADGRILKSSSIFIRDKEGEIHYLLGINYDITSIIGVSSGIRNLIGSGSGSEEDSDEKEKIPQNINDLLDTLIEESVQMIGKAPGMMDKEEKIRAIEFLNDQGAFLVTKSGDKVSNYFGISKFTLYNYIEQGKKKRA